MLLTVFGYDSMAVEQTDNALRGICGLSCLAPAISCILAALIMVKYPVTREAYEKILEAVANRKMGRTVNEEPFKKCL